MCVFEAVGTQRKSIYVKLRGQRRFPWGGDASHGSYKQVRNIKVHGTFRKCHVCYCWSDEYMLEGKRINDS